MSTQEIQSVAPQASASPLVCVRDLDFAYSDRLVLKHINLEVRRGTTLGLIGANGGGKTTLIRLLVGLLKPTRGTITIDGMTVAQAAARGDMIGYLPQRLEVKSGMPLSARQLIGLCGRGEKAGGLAVELLASVGLSDIADRPIGTLSGGQFQRLLIARALAGSPEVLILDEPTTGIDADSRRQFITLLQRLKRQLNLTIILSSHDLQSLHQLSDEVACLNLTMHMHQVSRKQMPGRLDPCGLPES